ncbi:nitrile hydratase subunit beta [Pontivivens ytuae]|uniref:Nitrile hydratase subunit beta n=1 Tax=Pontivivens ytuae TaxID=2789856 RepID=A0A7S9LSI0_9RHOB|nr:nitrile hydratase subunit beta [Pontivivens ytuae]QPH54160.1 nitrile hydratase subunit beta [Pontivivens ytuae]
MNGPQDLGGRMGFGPVAPEADEPLFHAEWEARVLGITLCCGALGHWTLDESRHARESLPWTDYLSFSYYRIWLTALIALLERHGEITAEELAGAAPRPGLRPERRLPAERVPQVLASGGPTDREGAAEPRFDIGAQVRARNLQPPGHIRMPGYVRGCVGRVEARHGAHVFPDTNAHGGGEQPQHLYTVVFEGRALWGPDGDPALTVSADLWESYLEPA